ncbi:MAG: hypothetical protein AB8H47_16450 [Bacteroidia bacterium]
MGLGYQALGQTIYSTRQLLSIQDSVAAQQLIQDNLRFLTVEKQNLALINELEFRTETDELDLSRQEYMMRLGLTNRKSRRAQDAITQNHIQYYQLQSQAVAETELINRYELILAWQKAQSKSAYLAASKPLLVDQKTVYQRLLEGSLDLDIKDLLKVESELQALEREQLQLRLTQESIARQLLGSNQSSNDPSLDSANWISLSTMSFVLDKVKSLPNENLAIAIQQSELDYEQLNLALEKAESSQVLDFVQLKYSGREAQTIQQEFSLGIGISIPTKASSRQKLNEAQLDLFDEQYKQSLLQAKVDQKISDYYTEYDQLVAAYQLLQQQIASNDLAGTLESYRNTGIVTPINLLRIKEIMLKDQRSLQKIEDEARVLFIKVIAIKGLLNQSPRTNYLSEQLGTY